MKASSSQPAIFLSPDAIHHADRCEPLVHAVRRGELQFGALARRGYPGRPLPAKMLPEISTVGFWDAKGVQNWGLDWHRNEGIELTYLARGKTDFLVEKQRFVLQSGQLTVTRPWQHHRLGNPNIGSSHLHWIILDVGVRRPDQPWRWPNWFNLSAKDRHRLTTLLSHNEQPVWPASNEIATGFERLADLVRHPSPASIESRLRLHIAELFLALLELLQTKNIILDARLVSTHRTVAVFLDALPGHLDHLWTLDEMAAQCGLARSRFSELCRKIVNMSPTDYLIYCRIEAAKQMLKAQPQRPVTDIGFACGFQSSQFFATTFHRRTGQTPRDFRDQP